MAYASTPLQFSLTAGVLIGIAQSGTTYAVILGTTLLPSTDVGGTFARSPDLTAVLGDTRPSEPHLAAAWDAYALLRDYIEAEADLDTADVLNATVFTTQSELDAGAFRDALVPPFDGGPMAVSKTVSIP